MLFLPAPRNGVQSFATIQNLDFTNKNWGNHLTTNNLDVLSLQVKNMVLKKNADQNETNFWVRGYPHFLSAHSARLR
jgi:hypothetical protein